MISAALALASPTLAFAGATVAAEAAPIAADISDAALVSTLPGFKQGFADVNGTRLHYVAGGKGEAVVLLPGWPETWWSYHKVMPTLAMNHRVIAVDIRGMGASSKPLDGYDKKNMAKDIHELMAKLGYDKAHIVGHDIGAQVAWSFAANYPQATRTLTMLDVPHPDEGLLKWPLLPAHGTFNDKIDENHAYAWWFAFHQVKGLPEAMMQGRAQIEHEWFFRYLLKDESALDARDRAVYAVAYNQDDGIRAGNAWYQAFTQDIIDEKSYGPLEMPVLGLAGPGYGWLNSVLTTRARNAKVYKLADSGHFIAEEQPEEMLTYLLPFLKQNASR
ncbi:alpha/beta hydrolase [Lysobacter terrestris]|uniref:Alpha/beta hydrolase n=2 Tax=Agrilutibacter terrestris TaxID=2865112 RepID=A0A7H0G1S6_9GAMM|nr:alpha/beta hydrolase [Lysobacter terrestris]